MLQTPIMRQRFEVIAVDLFGPLPESEDGHIWILIVEDVASRWTELFPLKTASAAACADTLLKEVILRYGVPRKIVSDNGTQFISATMQQVTFCLGIQQALTPVYHPAANPVERRNRDLKTQMAIIVGTDHSTWPHRLSSIRFAMNTTRCATTGMTPAYLTFGRELPSAGEVQRDLRTIMKTENFESEVTPRLREFANILHDAREKQEREQDRRKEYADQKRRITPTYRPGDMVWVTIHPVSKTAQRQTAKLAPKRDGPYRVLRQLGPVTFEIEDPQEGGRLLGTYHASALTPATLEDSNDVTPVQPIRRRGRPRKQPPPVQPPADQTSRRRGRPRKAPQPTEEDPEPSPRRLEDSEGEDVAPTL